MKKYNFYDRKKNTLIMSVVLYDRKGHRAFLKQFKKLSAFLRIEELENEKKEI